MAQTQSEKPGKIFAAIPSIMAMMNPISKDRTNTHQNFKFRGIDDVYNEIQKLLAANGVSNAGRVIDIQRKDRQTAANKLQVETLVTVEWTFYADDGSFITNTTPGESMDTGDKGTAKAMTVSHKTCLLTMFCVPTEGDNDNDANSPEAGKAKQNAKPIEKKTTQEKPGDFSKESPSAITAKATQPRDRVGLEIVKAANSVRMKPQALADRVSKLFNKGIDLKSKKPFAILTDVEMDVLLKTLVADAGAKGVES